MSLIKTIKAQLGLSNTATQNFTLTAEAADGTMKLARVNAGATTQDIITVDSSGVVIFPSGSQMLGVNQTWQNVTASRPAGIVHTNSTGKPITVIIIANVGTGSAGGSIAFSAGTIPLDKVIATGLAQITGSFTIVIPPGQSYSYTTAGTVNVISVFELR